MNIFHIYIRKLLARMNEGETISMSNNTDKSCHSSSWKSFCGCRWQSLRLHHPGNISQTGSRSSRAWTWTLYESHIKDRINGNNEKGGKHDIYVWQQGIIFVLLTWKISKICTVVFLRFLGWTEIWITNMPLALTSSHTPRALFALYGSQLPCNEKSKVINCVQTLVDSIPTEESNVEHSPPSTKIATVDGKGIVNKIISKPTTVKTVKDFQ